MLSEVREPPEIVQVPYVVDPICCTPNCAYRQAVRLDDSDSNSFLQWLRHGSHRERRWDDEGDLHLLASGARTHLAQRRLFRRPCIGEVLVGQPTQAAADTTPPESRPRPHLVHTACLLLAPIPHGSPSRLVNPHPQTPFPCSIPPLPISNLPSMHPPHLELHNSHRPPDRMSSRPVDALQS